MTDAGPSEPSAARRWYRWAPIAIGVLIVAVAAGILIARSGTQDDYDEAVQRRFLDACTGQGGEPVRDTCECFYDRIEQTVPFDRFEDLDESLAAEASGTASGQPLNLPPDIDALLQECVTATSGS